MGKPFVDRVGERYGRLTVLAYVGIGGGKGHYRMWLCQCDCGNQCTVSYRNLAAGHTRSCGCLFRESRVQGGHNRMAEGESAFNQLYYQYRRSARERGYRFELPEDQFRALTQMPCYYCGSPPMQEVPISPDTRGGYLYTGLDRIDNTIGYVPENVRPCCKVCNFAKGSMPEQVFLEWVQRVCRHLFA